MRGLAQRSPDRKHVQYADAFFTGEREHGPSCANIQDIESNHHHIPEALTEALLEHCMARIGYKAFGDSDEADFSFSAKPPHDRNKFCLCQFVILRLNTMKMINVYILRPEKFE